MGPSDGEGFHAMTEAAIESTVEAFAKAARLCRASGFDAVQIHAAHGYLLSQFLRRITISAPMPSAAVWPTGRVFCSGQAGAAGGGAGVSGAVQGQFRRFCAGRAHC